jgi:hypothetical protein
MSCAENRDNAERGRRNLVGKVQKGEKRRMSGEEKGDNVERGRRKLAGKV